MWSTFMWSTDFDLLSSSLFIVSFYHFSTKQMKRKNLFTKLYRLENITNDVCLGRLKTTTSQSTQYNSIVLSAMPYNCLFKIEVRLLCTFLYTVYMYSVSNTILVLLARHVIWFFSTYFVIVQLCRYSMLN